MCVDQTAPIVSRCTAQIFQIHTRTMNCERDIRFELLARLCPNSTGADIRSVCTEAGMYAVRGRRKTVTEKDFLDAVNKVGARGEDGTVVFLLCHRLICCDLPRRLSKGTRSSVRRQSTWSTTRAFRDPDL